MKRIYFLVISLGFIFTLNSQSLIKQGAKWSYQDNGQEQGTAWRQTNFDDSQWKSGEATLGYGSISGTSIKTKVNYGGNKDNKYITTYFRRNFTFNGDNSEPLALEFKTLIDDGAVIYLNGEELYRININFGDVTFSTIASASGNEYEYQRAIVWANNLKQGNNVIAVEVHQSFAKSSDMGFDLELNILPSNEVEAVNNIHFGSKNNPLDKLTITWHSNGQKDKIKWGYTSDFEKGTFNGAIHNEYFKNLFDYTFPSLNESSIIYYSIYNSTLNRWTPTKKYKTSVNIKSTKFSFTVLGDSRTRYSDWHKISKAIPKTDFSIFSGDVVSVGSSAIDWDNWFLSGESYIENNMIYHCLGNHDVIGGGLYRYKDILVLPQNKYNNETFYSFEYGNAIFICLDSEIAEDSTQYEWLLETLETYKDKTWKVVWYHSPFYTSPKHVGEMDDYFDTWWKAFDDYGIDVIFNGHTHNYQRTKPINRNVNPTGAVAEYGSEKNQGRCQIVSGSAGAPQYDVATGWFIEKSESIRHYCLVEIDGNSMKIVAKDENQNVIDSVSFEKKTKPNK